MSKPRLTAKRFRGLELMLEHIQKSALPWSRFGARELADMEAAEIWLRDMRTARGADDE